MTEEQYSIENYVADLRAITRRESDDALIAQRVKPLALRLATNSDWLKGEYRRTDPEQGFGMTLLHEETNHDLAVIIIAWQPGKGLKAHNHKTWAVVTGILGEEEETRYVRRDDGTRKGFADLRACGKDILHPGDVSVCLPEDIHSVRNPGSEVSVFLHTYGRHLNHTGRSEFDVEAKTEKPLIVKIENQ